jgi:hypothetical protein
LFIGGNILIFLFAFIGLWRFWRALQDSSATPGQTSFLQAMAATALGIISHSKFKDCDATGLVIWRIFWCFSIYWRYDHRRPGCQASCWSASNHRSHWPILSSGLGI